MRIHLANYEPDRIGGGWQFVRNFAKGFELTDYDESDIYFIAGPTLAERAQVQQAKADDKKIVLRLDNAVRNSNNRGTGMSRMRDFCDMADLVIYQSQWAKDFLMPFTDKDGPVILNGVDTSIYNSENRDAREDSYLYARSSRDEGKGWILAWYWFVNNKGTLEIAGKFSPENLEYNFDFYNGERFKFIGEQPSLVDSYKRNRYFLYTYLNDACSNTLLEALASGCTPVDVYGMLQTGGAPEILACKDLSIQRMNREYKEALNVLV